MTIAAVLGSKGGDIISVAPGDSVEDAVRLLSERRIGAVPVMDGGAVLGVFSERDVIQALAEHGPAALERPVSAAMTAPAVTAEPAQPVIAALSLMTRRRIRHLPVIEDGAVVGIVSIGDLVKYRIDRIEADADAMRSYIQSA